MTLTAWFPDAKLVAFCTLTSARHNDLLLYNQQLNSFLPLACIYVPSEVTVFLSFWYGYLPLQFMTIPSLHSNLPHNQN